MSAVDNGAVANTDQEIFASAFTDEEQEFDDDGDRSLEDMGDGPEGQIEPDDEETDDKVDAAADEKPGDPEKPEQPGKVKEPEPEPEEEEPEPELPRDPAGLRAAMVSERKARQAAEAANKAAREEIAAANARLDRLMAMQEQARPQPPPPPPPPKPDPVLDPEGYERYVVAQAEQRMTMLNIERSFAEAHETLGKEFEDAYSALQKLNPNNPVDKATGNRIYTAPDPAKAMMRWHREQTALREMGGDPAKYRQKIRDELLDDPEMAKAVFARWREQNQGGDPGRPRNITRLPPSLNRARGGSSDRMLGAADNTDAAVFDYAMNGRS